MSPRTASMSITATGLRIGIAYVPRPASVDGDAQRVQSALLEPRTAKPLPIATRLLGAIWRWL